MPAALLFPISVSASPGALNRKFFSRR